MKYSLVVLLFAIALFLASRQGHIPAWLPQLYLLCSALALLFYGWDKFCARRGWRRVPENTLHLLGLIGGWPGALLAQQWFRHKTVKTRFRVLFWLTVAANLTVLLVWYTPQGRHLLRALAAA